jgi:hypothetical protein
MRFLAILLCLFMLSACERQLTFLAGEDWQTGKAYTRTHWTGSNATSPALIYVTARTQQEWEALWQQVNETPPGPLPTSKMGVAVLLGQRPNEGWRVEITKAGTEMVFGQVEEYRVEYRIYKPDASSTADQIYTQSIASPWAIRLADYTPRVVDFNEVDK